MSIAITGSGTGASGVLTRSRLTAPSAAALQHVTVPIPSSLNLMATQSSSVTYRNRWYNVGGGTDNFLVDEFYRANRLGIAPPSVVPVIANGGGTGVTGTIVGYFRFRDSLTGERSPISGASNEITAANNDIDWSNIPTSSLDPRVDEIEFYRSVNGSTPRLACSRQLGPSAMTENVAALVLGDAYDVDYERIPRGTMNAIYHERHCVSGDARHPDTVYLSGVTFPERWEYLSVKTRNGEPVVGLIATHTVLLVLTPRSAYVLRGYTEEDMVLEPVSGDFGALNHFVLLMIEGRVFGADCKGPWVWDQGFHRIARNDDEKWRRCYRRYRTEYESAFAVANSNDYTYRIYLSSAELGFALAHDVPPLANVTGPYAKTIAWVAQYDDVTPEISGSMEQPSWVHDALYQRIRSGAMFSAPGQGEGSLYLGCTDGEIRRENPESATDDGDTFLKTMMWRTAAYSFGVWGGTVQEAKSLTAPFFTYMRSELNAWTVYLRGGNEEMCREFQSLSTDQFGNGEAGPFYPNNVDAAGGLFYKNTVPASASETATVVHEAETVHVHDVERVSGRTFIFEWRVTSPLKVRWSGCGGSWEVGTAYRAHAALIADGA